MNSTQAKPASASMVWKLSGLVALILLVPIILFFGVFPQLQGRPFETADELKLDEIKRFEVRLYNRTELDGGEDVGPYVARPDDYANLLKPLQGVPEVPDFSNARGPWLGEYRILLKNGRKGTIRLYWLHDQRESPLDLGFGSVAGTACEFLASKHGAIPARPPRLRYQIGLHKYEGGTAKELISVAEQGAAKAKLSR